MNNENPARAGWQQAWQRPHAVLLEIGWRWAFGLGAIALVAVASERLLAAVAVTPADLEALRSGDSVLMAGAALHLWQQAGGAILQVLVAVALVLSLLWLALATAGRALTLDLLLRDEDGDRGQPGWAAAEPGRRRRANYAAVLGINFLRVLWLWLALLVCLLVVMGSAFVAVEVGGGPETPNFAIYLLLVAMGVPLALGLWGTGSWYLALAPVLCVGEGWSAFAAIGGAWDRVRAQRGAFASTTISYGMPRVIAFIVLLVAATGAASGIAGWPAATVVVAALSLAYFAFADFLYLARLAAYARLLLPQEKQAGPAEVLAAPAAPETSRSSA